MRFKIVRLTTICNGAKRIMFASGGLGLLQMVSELDIGRGPPRGWIVKFHIGWRGERNIVYKGVETFP